MSNLKLRALAGACALLGASGLAAASHAANVINGGGSTSAQPYWVQTAHCFDTSNTSFVISGIPATTVADANSPGCTPMLGVDTINYDTTGSGAGQAGLFANTAVISSPGAGLLFGSTDPAGTMKVYATVQYSLSDVSLGNSDLAIYDVGTGNSNTVAFNGNTSTTVASANLEGLTFTTVPTSATNFPIPKGHYGALVQIPIFITPVALAYNQTYLNASNHPIPFNIQSASGKLDLDASTYCKIFTHQIVNWNDPAITALNGGVSLKGVSDLSPTFSVPIVLVGDSQSSGITSIFTRHLANVCTGKITGSNPYVTGATTLPSAVSSLYTLAPGSIGVAGVIHSTQGAIGYLGTEFVLPAVVNTGANSFNLNAAALKNSAGNFEVPNATTAIAAFGTTTLPPQSAISGAFVSTDTTTDRRDPTQWVQSTAPTVPLANPTGSGAYPIVGVTSFIGYTCYAAASSVAAIDAFLTFNASAQGGTLLANAGLAQMPAAWLNAINNTFLTTTGDAHTLNLFIAQAGSSSTNPNCKVSGVTGG